MCPPCCAVPDPKELKRTFFPFKIPPRHSHPGSELCNCRSWVERLAECVLREVCQRALFPLQTLYKTLCGKEGKEPHGRGNMRAARQRKQGRRASATWSLPWRAVLCLTFLSQNTWAGDIYRAYGFISCCSKGWEVQYQGVHMW